MKKISPESYYQRLKELAEVNKATVNESKNRNLGILIDYKRATDGIAYGIIKENHLYYIKKAGIKNDPDITDFAYIGGLANITNFQYRSLSEADKNRNMLLQTINEAALINFRNKKKINEDKADDEIDMAKKKLGDLDAATDAEETSDAEIAAGLEAEPNGSGEGSEEMPAPEGGEEAPAPEGGEEAPAPEGGEEAPDADALAAEESEPIKEIEKAIGKLTNSIRKTELEPAQVKSFVNSYLAAFKDKFPDVEIEDRKDMANKILKVVPPEDVEALSISMPADEVGNEMKEEDEMCSECGNFAMYAESMGFNSPQSLMECGEEGVTNLISGYANANADGMNDGDHENVALLIKVINPEMLNTLKNDYGHEEYANKLAPYVQEMNEETEEESMQKLDELWGGLKNMFGKVGGDIGAGTKKAGQAVSGAVQKGAQAVSGAVQKGAQAVSGAVQKGAQAAQQYGKNVKQAYYKGEQQAAAKELNKLAQEFKSKVDAMNANAVKAGGEPVDMNTVLSILTQQLTATVPTSIMNNPSAINAWQQGKARNLGALGMKEEIEEDTDPATVEVNPSENNNIEFAGAQTLGAGVVKPAGAPTSITVESKDGTKVEVGLHEVLATIKKTLNEAKMKSEGNAFTKGLAKTPKGGTFKVDGKITKDTSNYDKNVDEGERPSAGLSKEKKSEIVKKAKRGEDIGKKGKGFEKVEKIAKKSGAEDPKAVAAAAMWKNIKREGTEKENKKPISESEIKLRKYIRQRLEEKAGIRKANLNESAKSSAIKRLDELIDKQFEIAIKK